jgi:hypothetical protein
MEIFQLSCRVELDSQQMRKIRYLKQPVRKTEINFSNTHQYLEINNMTVRWTGWQFKIYKLKVKNKTT